MAVLRLHSPTQVTSLLPLYPSFQVRVALYYALTLTHFSIAASAADHFSYFKLLKFEKRELPLNPFDVEYVVFSTDLITQLNVDGVQFELIDYRLYYSL
jgi:hypothetical protein